MSQTALITGASGGLGLEFAKIFSREGYDLFIVARREGILYKLKSELESQYHNHVEVFACDLSKTNAAYEVFNYTLEKNIQIDVLVNNAGFGDFGNFWTVDERKQINLLQVNIVTLVQLTRYFMPGMMDRHYGKVLNLSPVASFCAGPKMSLYYASKEFVRSFSEAIAEAGYKAMMKKKVLLYYGASTKLMNIGARIAPRSISRKFAGKING